MNDNLTDDLETLKASTSRQDSMLLNLGLHIKPCWRCKLTMNLYLRTGLKYFEKLNKYYYQKLVFKELLK